MKATLRPMAIGLDFAVQAHLEEGLTGLTPATLTPLDKGVGRGNCFGFQTLKIGGW